jgi:hypothetical protein
LGAFPVKKAEKFGQERGRSLARMIPGESSFRKERRKRKWGLIGQGVQKPGRLLLKKRDELLSGNSILTSQTSSQDFGGSFTLFPEFAYNPGEGFQDPDKIPGRKSAEISCDQQLGFRPTKGLGFFKGTDSTGPPKTVGTAKPQKAIPAGRIILTPLINRVHGSPRHE